MRCGVLTRNQIRLIVTIRQCAKRSMLGCLQTASFILCISSSLLIYLSIILCICPSLFSSVLTCVHYVCFAEHAVRLWGVFILYVLGTSSIFKILPAGETLDPCLHCRSSHNSDEMKSSFHVAVWSLNIHASAHMLTLLCRASANWPPSLSPVVYNDNRGRFISGNSVITAATMSL